MNQILRALRQDAREWWYHKHLRHFGGPCVTRARHREHRHARETIQCLRDTLTNGGYLAVRPDGGWTLHVSDTHTLSGYVSDSGVPIVAPLLGIPVYKR